MSPMDNAVKCNFDRMKTPERCRPKTPGNNGALVNSNCSLIHKREIMFTVTRLNLLNKPRWRMCWPWINLRAEQIWANQSSTTWNDTPDMWENQSIATWNDTTDMWENRASTTWKDTTNMWENQTSTTWKHTANMWENQSSTTWKDKTNMRENQSSTTWKNEK